MSWICPCTISGCFRPSRGMFWVNTPSQHPSNTQNTPIKHRFLCISYRRKPFCRDCGFYKNAIGKSFKKKEHVLAFGHTLFLYVYFELGCHPLQNNLARKFRSNLHMMFLMKGNLKVISGY
ncbi:hypothetical protein ACVWYN_002106 [Pedobacter sp. UYP24]